MGILDDTAIFAAVIQQGGFSHAAKHLGLSNGLVSRRIMQLEADLGVTLIKRTTRQLQLTPEGELFCLHAQRIQQELNSALGLIQSSTKKLKGSIRISAPLFFGKQYLTPMLIKFLNDFKDIKIDLILSNNKLDPIKAKLDLAIRGAGYLQNTSLSDSSMQMKLLYTEKIALYASPEYLLKYGAPKKPKDLIDHVIINYAENNNAKPSKWNYQHDTASHAIAVQPKFNVNDIESALNACIAGYGIGKFTELNVRNMLLQKQLQPILSKYDWGTYNLYAVYARQQALPKRTRMLLDFIHAHLQAT